MISNPVKSKALWQETQNTGKKTILQNMREVFRGLIFDHLLEIGIS
jgi:hypothetical protein